MKVRIHGRTLLPVVLLSVLAAAALPAEAERRDVLVIVNDNSVDSPQVGEYYASQRGIAPDLVLHVSAPAGYFITWNEFRVLRDQIIKFMQENTLDDPNLVPVVCTDGDPPYYCAASTDQLRLHTTIRRLVLTRGVPTRMTVDGSLLYAAGAPTSVDNYLKYWLIQYFSTDWPLAVSSRDAAFGDGRGMREVIPAEDGELVVGRIDGLDLVSAERLVDRAMDVENVGLYGKLYGSKYGSTGGLARWWDYAASTYVYGDAATSWRYQLGLLGEARSECIDYLDFPASQSAGKAPQYCFARMTDGSDPPPARASSREPLADDAQFYLGSLDGQATTGSFAEFLNWRRDDTCTVTLCRDAADPAACRAASTDVFHEIDTRCAGVADGFIGYNFQSYPVSFLAVWPTAWFQSTSNTNWNHLGGGDVNYLGFPEIREDLGRTDSFCLALRNTDQVADPRCYPDSDFSGPPTVSCLDLYRLNINQKITFATRYVDPVNPQQYRIGVWYRTVGVSPSRVLRARFFVHEQGAGSAVVDYGTQDLATITGDAGWTWVEAVYTLDPSLHTNPDLSYDGVKVRFETNSTFSGELDLDDASVMQVGENVELATNTGFDDGHRQVSAGDHAANFLCRLNGAGFFGSLSHHESGGHSFDNHPQETLLYFLRGLPLGDAVWWAEPHNSGILYGDPLFRPVAVMLDYLNDEDRVLDRMAPLFGSTVNGRDPVRVTTTWTLDYCPGGDFYVCDRDGSWMPTGLAGDGGQEHSLLGLWDTSGIAFGTYTLRLAVTSTRADDAKQRTFYDYYPVLLGYPFDEVTGVTVSGKGPTTIAWDSQDGIYGTATVYDLVSGSLLALRADGGFAGATCLADDDADTPYKDNRSKPASGDGYYYLVRSQQGTDRSSWGDGTGLIPDPRNDLDLAAPCP